MLENYITQVRHSKGVSSEREAFVSRAAQASTAACYVKELYTLLATKVTVSSITTPIIQPSL